MKEIYLDNAAATPIDARVQKAMTMASKHFGNPSSFNHAGRLAREDIKEARLTVARFLNARPEEIVFTSSGSEANNLAIKGVLAELPQGTVLTTPIEHVSVLEALKTIKHISSQYIAVNGEGLADLQAISKTFSSDCRLVSVMYANNEIGTIQPIRALGRLIAEYNKAHSTQILFHVDACQAAGLLDMNVQRLGVDLLTFNGSKIYGPRGIGVLFIRRGLKLSSLIVGGSQERGFRGGTENGPAIIGLAKALSLIKPTESKKIAEVRDHAVAQLEKHIPGIRVNGPRGEGRLANNINISVPGLESETLLLELDKYGISAGSGSACTSHAVDPSHVLKAIGVPAKYLDGALRFSLGRETTKKDIDYLISALSKIVPTLTKRYARSR